ncbi:MAG: DUF1460 domain-containing protein [Bacteroidaceae bacterium]|nr:DUF1460 domain-containing protein [Bacteroidaceae bacterium]
MNRWIITLLAFVFALGVKAQGVEYTKEDSALVVKLLKEAKTERGTQNRVLYFGKEFWGLPYVAHTLELGDTEHLIVNLHGLDCTTFVETVVALSMCDKQDKRSFDDYCKNLTKIRFREGKMTDYTSRLHYFTWWAEDNERLGIVEDIAPQAAPWGAFTAVQTININYMSTHPTLYKQLKNHPDFVAPIKKYEQATNGRKFRYIPKTNLQWSQSTDLGVIHDGDIVAMLTDSDGLDTRHIGIAFWKNGRLHLLHASSLYKKVLMSEETFYEYEMKQQKHTGIRVFRFKD